MYGKKSAQIINLMILLDIVFSVSSFLLSFWLRNYIFSIEKADFFSHFSLIPLFITLQYFFLLKFGAYSRLRTASIRSFSWAVLWGVVASIAVILAVIFVLRQIDISRGIIILFAGINIIAVISIRVAILQYFRYSVKKGKNILNILIIGTAERAMNLSKELRLQSDWGINIIGHIDPDPERVGTKVLDAPVIGTIQDISKVLKNHVVDEVIMAIPRTMIMDVEEIAYACEEEGVMLRYMANIYELDADMIRLIKLGGTYLLTIESVAQNENKLIIKRLIDLTLSIVSLPVILPVMGIVAIAIKFDSPGPVFYIQKRVGLQKRLFPLLKFRSMYVGSEARLKEIEYLNEAEGPIFKMKKDPRVTRVGKFIRKTSLDELPQLLNVIRGEMSLVGPRPMTVRDVALFDKGIQRKRFSVKPGITCLWQISGRSSLPFSKWIELDLEYIDKWSLWLDMKILIKTVPIVFKREGAY